MSEGSILKDIQLARVRSAIGYWVGASAFRHPAELLAGQPLHLCRGQASQPTPLNIGGRIHSVSVGADDWPVFDVDCGGQPAGRALLAAVAEAQPGSIRLHLETESVVGIAEKAITQVLTVTSVSAVVRNPQTDRSDEIPELYTDRVTARPPGQTSSLALWSLGVK